LGFFNENKDLVQNDEYLLKGKMGDEQVSSLEMNQSASKERVSPKEKSSGKERVTGSESLSDNQQPSGSLINFLAKLGGKVQKMAFGKSIEEAKKNLQNNSGKNDFEKLLDHNIPEHRESQASNSKSENEIGQDFKMSDVYGNRLSEKEKGRGEKKERGKGDLKFNNNLSQLVENLEGILKQTDTSLTINKKSSTDEPQMNIKDGPDPLKKDTDNILLKANKELEHHTIDKKMTVDNPDSKFDAVSGDVPDDTLGKIPGVVPGVVPGDIPGGIPGNNFSGDQIERSDENPLENPVRKKEIEQMINQLGTTKEKILELHKMGLDKSTISALLNTSITEVELTIRFRR